MSALLLPGETLTLGLNVIVREGDYGGLMMNAIQEPFYVAPQDWVALTGPCPTCGGHGQLWHIGTISKGPSAWKPCPDCRDGRRIVPLYTECAKCHPFNGDPADGGRCQTCGIKYHCYRCNHPCNLMATGHGEGKCENHDGRVMVGRGSIEVVPVEPLGGQTLGYSHIMVGQIALLRIWHDVDGRGGGRYEDTRLALDPLPVPGRDFGIVIDCVEVAS